MAVVEQGVTGPDEKDKSKQVPFKFLGEDIAGIEKITHDNINKYDQHQAKRNPGHAPADPFVGSIDPRTQLF